ncbi:hypothetical protein QBC38DRAFT_490046 [Podospora fimiseda]|uniref:MYND-type domain-containing protein n=1 Tax=Podospora fimiseda TaxID=252190 RepID=A0AAN6YPN4_9PEZI|nr:hypothetical protein QBC38DRAFT_490046 [Podospora fimiseda]
MFTPPKDDKNAIWSYGIADINPAISLTQDLPQGLDADILTVSGGDVRDILYTLYSEKGFPKRRLDVTAAATKMAFNSVNIARHVLLFTLILDGKDKVSADELWNIYYQLYLHQADFDLVIAQASKLCRIANNVEGWNSGPYGKTVQFRDKATFDLARSTWAGYLKAKRTETYKQQFEHIRTLSDERKEAIYGKLGECVVPSSARSCAPLSTQIMKDMVELTEMNWQNGLTGRYPPQLDLMSPNPIIATVVSEKCLIEYPADPLIAFHLAAARVKLTDLSPLRLDEELAASTDQPRHQIVTMAKVQWEAWTDAFRDAAARTTIRFVKIAEFFSFCETLKQEESGDAPNKFDAIHTSSLADQFGILNALVATGPLLKPLPSSTIYTEALLHNTFTGNKLDSLLGTHTTAITTLLGLSPTEYWTNATATSLIDGIIATWSGKSDMTLQFRLAWKQNNQVSGVKTKLAIEPSPLARILYKIYRQLSIETNAAFVQPDSVAQMFAARGFGALCTAINKHVQVNSDALFEELLSLLVHDGHADMAHQLSGVTRQMKEMGLQRAAISSSSPTGEPTFTTVIDEKTNDVTAIVGHLDITSDLGKKLLADKSIPISLQQASPYIINIHFSKARLILPLTFPVPVSKENSKTRIARTSQYIEVIAPIADALKEPVLDDYICPVVLLPSHIPTTLGNIPSLSLETLPILATDDKARIRFINSLTSLVFSARERRIREEANQAATPSALTVQPSPRVNFKESLFTMFMITSGLQGGQTGLFAISHPSAEKGVNMLVFVSAIRLDAAHGGVVLDAAIIPFTKSLVDSGVLEEFLLILRTLECCTITVDDAELLLWKKCLPALAERCRTWEHDKHKCEYIKQGQVPVSLEDGGRVLCSCGQGKLPDGFITLPEWDTAAKYATRVAISPMYSSPIVEELVDPALVKTPLEQEVEVDRCRNCGKTEGQDELALKKCARCLAVKYCSGACQKKDWKKHRAECAE